MRRMKRDDEGAVLVFVTIGLAALLLMAAFALDVGQFFTHRARAQNSADAQALAVGLNCANGWPANNKLPALKTRHLAASGRAVRRDLLIVHWPV